MKIQGNIIQIIPPEEAHSFFGKSIQKAVRGKFMVVIQEPNTPVFLQRKAT